MSQMNTENFGPRIQWKGKEGVFRLDIDTFKKKTVMCLYIILPARVIMLFVRKMQRLIMKV